MRRFIGTVLATLALTVVPLGPARAAAHDPVVFVHGYGGSGGNFGALESHLRAAGWSAGQLFEFNYNSNQSNQTSAAQLKTFVANVRSQTGAARVDLVSHSMGGMVTRWYVKMLGGAPVVDAYVSLAGANHGTTAAGLCYVFAACREMYPGSSFLTQLNSGDETPGAVRYSTYYSSCDGVIHPYTSTLLAGAANHDVGCVTHVGFLSSHPFYDSVRQDLG